MLLEKNLNNTEVYKTCFVYVDHYLELLYFFIFLLILLFI